MFPLGTVGFFVLKYIQSMCNKKEVIHSRNSFTVPTRTEAEVMRELLIARGVPENLIRLEDRSHITLENVRNACALLGEGKRVALVTSDYHMARALDDCRRAGLDALGICAMTPEGPYRQRMFAQERRIAEGMRRQRQQGMSDQDLIREHVSRMFSQPPGRQGQDDATEGRAAGTSEP